MSLIHRTPVDGERGGGWRIRLPVLAWWRTGYDVRNDAIADGWWAFRIGISAERLGAYNKTHGVQVRVTWGWSLLRTERVRTDVGAAHA